MSREWKPGDVAVLQWENEPPTVAIRIAGCKMSGHPAVDHWHTDQGRFGLHPDTARPLVVIDPEDREQVERLTGALAVHGVNANDRNYWRETQAALRSLVADPKPYEPTGLGAVVEDAQGTPWVRCENADLEPHWYARNKQKQWSDIAAVKVLSEGVQP